MKKTDFIYSMIIVFLIFTNFVIYNKLHDLENNPLNKFNDLEKAKLLQKTIYENNISLSNSIDKKKAEWIYFYFEYSKLKNEIELIKVYQFDDNTKVLESQGFYELQ